MFFNSAVTAMIAGSSSSTSTSLLLNKVKSRSIVVLIDSISILLGISDSLVLSSATVSSVDASFSFVTIVSTMSSTTAVISPVFGAAATEEGSVLTTIAKASNKLKILLFIVLIPFIKINFGVKSFIAQF